MTKKNIPYTIIFVFLLLTSCGGDDPFSVLLDVDPPEHFEQLAVHCYVSSRDDVITASLSETRGLLDVTTEIQLVNDGLISLYNNGSKLFDFSPTSSFSPFINYAYDNSIEFGTKNGEMELRVEASGFPEMTAQQIFPTFVPVTEVVIAKEAAIDLDGEVADRLEITFTDPGSEENFYEIGLVRSDGCGDSGLNRSIYLETQDPNVQIGADDESIIMSDAGFDGAEFKLILAVDSNWTGDYDDVYLSWKCISKDHFLYSSSLAAFNRVGELGGFSEPVSIYSNVENGIGIFTCSTDELYPAINIRAISNEFTATINDELYTPCLVSCKKEVVQPGEDLSLRLMTRQDEDALFINIKDYSVGELTAADFEMVFLRNSFAYILTQDQNFIITAHDENNKVISGNFSGIMMQLNGVETIEVTDLSFTVYYTE